MHEVHNKTQFVKKFCNRSAASAAAAELELRGHAGEGCNNGAILRNKAVIVVAGLIVNRYYNVSF